MNKIIPQRDSLKLSYYKVYNKVVGLFYTLYLCQQKKKSLLSIKFCYSCFFVDYIRVLLFYRDLKIF